MPMAGRLEFDFHTGCAAAGAAGDPRLHGRLVLRGPGHRCLAGRWRFRKWVVRTRRRASPRRFSARAPGCRRPGAHPPRRGGARARRWTCGAATAKRPLAPGCSPPAPPLLVTLRREERLGYANCGGAPARRAAADADVPPRPRGRGRPSSGRRAATTAPAASPDPRCALDSRGSPDWTVARA